MHDYKLRFTDEAQANAVLDAALGSLKIWDYEKHTIGIHTECLAYDEDGACTESVEWAGWHVDLRSTVELPSLDAYRVNPEDGETLHEFA